MKGNLLKSALSLVFGAIVLQASDAFAADSSYRVFLSSYAVDWWGGETYYAKSEADAIAWVQSRFDALAAQTSPYWYRNYKPALCVKPVETKNICSASVYSFSIPFPTGWQTAAEQNWPGIPVNNWDPAFGMLCPRQYNKIIPCRMQFEARESYSGWRAEEGFPYAWLKAPSYKIKIVPSDDLGGSSHGDGYIADVWPSGTLAAGVVSTRTFVATVVDGSDRPVPNVDIKITLKANSGSGGHQHDVDDSNRPAGSLNGVPSSSGNPAQLTGNTGDNGLTFTYDAPEASGDYTLEATCADGGCTQDVANKVWVGIPGLVQIPPTTVWQLYDRDSTRSHPGSHFLRVQAIESLAVLAALYKGLHPNAPVLWLNDSSLERGGLFDCYTLSRVQWWKKPHAEHRLGIVVDVQANGEATAIPDENVKDFEKLITNVIRGSFVEELGAGHIHVRLLGSPG